jgi:hypothetical protein
VSSYSFILGLPFELILAKHSGGFHDHGEEEPWITVEYTDSQGRVLLHKKADGNTWDRIHLYRDIAVNYLPHERPVSIWAR